MSIGERISQLRIQQGLSQYELAKIMDVSRQAVSKWENDQTAPDALKLIRLAQVLDTDIEYLSVGRQNFGRRPPVVIKTVETVEKIVEKPIIQIQEMVVEKVGTSPPAIQYVEKPVIRKIYRTKYLRNPFEYFVLGVLAFAFGLLVGKML